MRKLLLASVIAVASAIAAVAPANAQFFGPFGPLGGFSPYGGPFYGGGPFYDYGGRYYGPRYPRYLMRNPSPPSSPLS
jgi:hypothetical protein